MEVASPYIFPFIIEFALIGAMVAYIMSGHIGKRYLQLKTRIVYLSKDLYALYTPKCKDLRAKQIYFLR
jgi:hypothetical protein